MGILGIIKDQVASRLKGSEHDEASGAESHLAIVGMATGLFERMGGISGLVERFQSHGLGDVIHSWVGTGENQPINAEQLQKALGSDVVSHLAHQFGMDTPAMAQKLTQYLPLLVDHLTPNGQIPSGNLTKEQMLSAATSLFRNRQ